jgi:hypothetical protein
MEVTMQATEPTTRNRLAPSGNGRAEIVYALGGLGVLGWGIEALFALMACGLVSYGMVMVAVIRRELGLYPGGR